MRGGEGVKDKMLMQQPGMGVGQVCPEPIHPRGQRVGTGQEGITPLCDLGSGTTPGPQFPHL